ncbi:hypothetical protein [Flavobacterium sp.]|uniref:hypothetical protein n=1 Tax=Flavobacterium sp. TaxID=239 RepID=UPI00286DEE87|nr:hypothetical protein [Flavobacterium sp.]
MMITQTIRVYSKKLFLMAFTLKIEEKHPMKKGFYAADCQLDKKYICHIINYYTVSRKGNRVGNILNFTIMGTIFYLMMGWCGTKYPGWWRNPNPPGPQPEPWRQYGINTIIGIVAGLVAGTLFNNAISDSALFSEQSTIASGLVAFAASGIITEIAGSFSRK